MKDAYFLDAHQSIISACLESLPCPMEYEAVTLESQVLALILEASFLKENNSTLNCIEIKMGFSKIM